MPEKQARNRQKPFIFIQLMVVDKAHGALGMQAPDRLPPPVMTNATNPFAHHTMAVRVPGILDEIRALNPDYPPMIDDALRRLRDELVEDKPLRMLDLSAPDYEAWMAAFRRHEGQSWQNTVWFFAETFLYRHVIQAVRWWETGRDPFAPKKAEEYAGETVWRLLEAALSLQTSAEARLSELLNFALWGNRMDLSFAASMAHGVEAAHEDLLVDDRAVAVEQIVRGTGDIHIIADNAGTELAMDCALIDTLLDIITDRVLLHVKLHPTFVSDATPADVWAFIGMLESRGFGSLAGRLKTAFERGRFCILPHPYWNSSRFLWEMPGHLADMFKGTRLVIVKGDANYRRMIGDALWPADTPFADVVGYFPAPLLALRTLKSDPLVGLQVGLAATLDGVDAKWRVNGKRGVMQFSLALRSDSIHLR
jgi:uncharacterized protein with ATP-grasp and redox domains